MLITQDCIDEPPDVQDLLTRARQGDAQAFCALAEAHEGRLYRQAVALSKDPSLAEDLVSETFVEAWKSLGRYNESCRFSTWLFAILLHRYQKSVRKARSRPVPLAALRGTEAERERDRLENLPAAGPTPAEAAAHRELNRQLREAIDALPAKHRDVILLRFFEDASLPEIAAVLGCSLGTVKSRLHHALEKLRRVPMAVNLSDLSGDTPV